MEKINRRKAILMIGKGLVGGAALSFLSCERENLIFKPDIDGLAAEIPPEFDSVFRQQDVEELKSILARHISSCMNGMRLENHSPHPSVRYSTSSWDFSLVMKNSAIQGVEFNKSGMNLIVRFTYLGKMSGAEWVPSQSVTGTKNLQIRFPVVSENGTHTIIDPLPPYCAPMVLVSHLQKNILSSLNYRPAEGFKSVYNQRILQLTKSTAQIMNTY